MNYLDTVNKRTLEYFKVLEPDFPEWLWEYINTEALFKQNYISVTCGTIYSDLFESSFRSFDWCSFNSLAFYT